MRLMKIAYAAGMACALAACASMGGGRGVNAVVQDEQARQAAAASAQQGERTDTALAAGAAAASKETAPAEPPT